VGEPSSKDQSAPEYTVGRSELGHRQDNYEVQSIFDQDGQLRFDYLDAIIEKSLIQSLKVNIQDTPILFTESAIHNKEYRMKLTEYMFEKYKIPALFLVKDPVLCSFSCGRSSALVLDIGHKASIATPVHDGYALLKCSIKHDIGGKSLSRDLFKFLTEKKGHQIQPRYSFKKKYINTEGQEVMQVTSLPGDSMKGITPNYHEWSQMEIIREMKEDFLTVSDDFLQQRVNDTSRIGAYELPDGTQVQLNSFERQIIPEKLFQVSQ
jgi:actin-like protein 6A